MTTKRSPLLDIAGKQSERITFAGTVTAEGRRLRGSVQLAGQRTWRNGEWLEVDPAALVAADASDVVARLDHDPGKVLGRTSNSTVRLSRTDQGIDYEVDELPNTTYANDTLELVRGGYITGSSFEIEGMRSTFLTDPEDGSRIRRITHIDRLTDVSPVFHPAFTASSVAAFSKETPMSDETTTAPETPAATVNPPAPAPEPKSATFAEKPGVVAQFAAAARQLTTEQIADVMDNIMAESGGDLSGEMLERYEAFASVHAERTAVSTEERDRASRMKALHDLRLGRVPKAPTESGLVASDDYREAFNRYIRGNITAMEQFAQSIAGDGTQGGYTVPEDFRTKITETMAAYGGIQQEAEELTTGDGRALPWPTNNDTANSAAVASEGSAPASGGADLVFGEVSLGAFSIAATGAGNAPLKVSWELLQDSQIDFAAFVARKLGERLGRKKAALYATGVGTTEPFGLLAKTPDSMTATTMFAALVEHMFQVNEAYRSGGNCRWVMSDTTLAKVYGSVDLNGRPLFIPSADASGAGRPAGTLLGFPVRLDQGAGNLVAFGDIRAGYIIRNVRGIEVVVDPYNNTATRQNAYHAWTRTDANIQDSAAVSVSDYSSVTADATA